MSSSVANEPNILTVPEYNISDRLLPEEYKQCRNAAMLNVAQCESIRYPERRHVPPTEKNDSVLQWLASDRASFMFESPSHSHMLIEKLFDARLKQEFDEFVDENNDYPNLPTLGTNKVTRFLFKSLQVFKTCEWFVLSVWASIALRRSRRDPTNDEARKNWQAFKLAIDYNKPLSFEDKCSLTNNNYCSYLAIFASTFCTGYDSLISKINNSNSRRTANLKFHVSNRHNFGYHDHDMSYMWREYGICRQDLLNPKSHFLSVLDGYAIFAMPNNDNVQELPSQYYSQYAREGAHLGQTDFFANCDLKWTRAFKSPRLDLPSLHSALKNLYASSHLCIQNKSELGIEAFVGLMNSLADYLVTTTLPVLELLAEAVKFHGTTFIHCKKDFKVPCSGNAVYIDFKSATNHATLAATAFNSLVLKAFEYFKAYYLDGWDIYEANELWKSNRHISIPSECIYGVVGPDLFQVHPLTPSLFCPVWHKIKDSLLRTIANKLRCSFAQPFAGDLIFDNLLGSFEMYVNVLPFEYMSTEKEVGVGGAAVLFNNLVINCGNNTNPLYNIQQMLCGVEVNDLLKFNLDNADKDTMVSGIISGVKNGFLSLFSKNASLAYDIFGLWKTKKQILRPQSYTSLPIYTNKYDDADLIIVQLNNAYATGGYIRHRLENNNLQPPRPEYEVHMGRLTIRGKSVNMYNIAKLALIPWQRGFPEDVYIVLYVIEMFHALLRNTFKRLNHEVIYTEYRLATKRSLVKNDYQINASSYLHCYLHQFVPERVRAQVVEVCRMLERGNMNYTEDLTPEMALMTNPVIAKFIIDLEQGNIHISPN